MRREVFAMIAALTIAVPALAQESQGAKDLEDQWLFRELRSSGAVRPTATFMAWHYMGVVFHASCSAPAVIELNYLADDPMEGSPAIEVKEMGFIRGNASVKAAATPQDNPKRFVATFPVNPMLLDILKPAKDDLMIDAENEMGEPWYVGQAFALHQVATACRG